MAVADFRGFLDLIFYKIIWCIVRQNREDRMQHISLKNLIQFY